MKEAPSRAAPAAVPSGGAVVLQSDRNLTGSDPVYQTVYCEMGKTGHMLCFFICFCIPVKTEMAGIMTSINAQSLLRPFWWHMPRRSVSNAIYSVFA